MGPVRLVLVGLLAVAISPLHARTEGPPVPELPPVGPSTFRRPAVLDWPAGQVPTAPAGFQVEVFARDLENPRWLYVLPNGDVLVSQARTERLGGMSDEVVQALTDQGILGPSPNNIILLREPMTV